MLYTSYSKYLGFRVLGYIGVREKMTYFLQRVTWVFPNFGHTFFMSLGFRVTRVSPDFGHTFSKSFLA